MNAPLKNLNDVVVLELRKLKSEPSRFVAHLCWELRIPYISSPFFKLDTD